jgi:hypothetical protein
MRLSSVHRLAVVLALCASGCTPTGATTCVPSATGYPCCSASADEDAGLLPPDPDAAPPDGTGSVVLAISKVYYGDTNRDGSPTCNPWRQYGLDIDGKITTKTSTDVCALNAGSASIAQEDGENGIDNSFGTNLLPILTTFFGSTTSQNGNAALSDGDETTLVRLDEIGTDSDYSPLWRLVYHAASTSMPPRWDGTDVRDVDIASLVSGDLASPVVTLSGYMNGRTWVGTPPGEKMLFDLHMAAAGISGRRFPSPTCKSPCSSTRATARPPAELSPAS